jgi:hypothetical protein
MEKISARSQHARDFRQKLWTIRITVRRFNVEDRVESFWFKRKILGVTLDKDESGNVVVLLAETDSGGVQIESGVALRLQGAGEIRRAAAVTAAYFQNFLTAQRRLGGDVMIKLDAGAIRLVPGRQRKVQRRRFLISVVEEEHVIAEQPPGKERIPEPPKGFANPADGEEMINDGHGELLRQSAAVANVVPDPAKR